MQCVCVCVCVCTPTCMSPCMHAIFETDLLSRLKLGTFTMVHSAKQKCMTWICNTLTYSSHKIMLLMIVLLEKVIYVYC